MDILALAITLFMGMIQPQPEAQESVNAVEKKPVVRKYTKSIAQQEYERYYLGAIKELTYKGDL